MARSRYLPDRGLTAWMGGTIFLLGALFMMDAPLNVLQAGKMSNQLLICVAVRFDVWS